MTSQIIFKVEKKIKDKAMKKAQREGIAFAAILKLATQAYIAGDLNIKLVPLNVKTRRELAKISNDITTGKKSFAEVRQRIRRHRLSQDAMTIQFHKRFS